MKADTSDAPEELKEKRKVVEVVVVHDRATANVEKGPKEEAMFGVDGIELCFVLGWITRQETSFDERKNEVQDMRLRMDSKGRKWRIDRFETQTMVIQL